MLGWSQIYLKKFIINYIFIFCELLSGGDRRAQSLHSILSQTLSNQRGDGGLG